MGKKIGVIEGFFGPAWSLEDRMSYASFMKEARLDFYIYAPKNDQFLRKDWKKSHPKNQADDLKRMASRLREEGISFGIGLSPLDLCYDKERSAMDRYKMKLQEICLLGIDYLGIFFDDMKSEPQLAERQIELVNMAKSEVDARVVFCPTYYSTDPILDKVFGPRPDL